MSRRLLPLLVWGAWAIVVVNPLLLLLIGDRPIGVVGTAVLTGWVLLSMLLPAVVLPLRYRRALLGFPACLLMMAPVALGFLLVAQIIANTNVAIGLIGYLLLIYGSPALLIDLCYKAFRHDWGLGIAAGSLNLIAWGLAAIAAITGDQFLALVLPPSPGGGAPFADLRIGVGWLLNISAIAVGIGVVGWAFRSLVLIRREGLRQAPELQRPER